MPDRTDRSADERKGGAGETLAPKVRSPRDDIPEAAGDRPAAINRRRRAQASPLSSIGDLLRAAYGRERKRLAPRKAEIAAMHSAVLLSPSDREELLRVSASDRTLERTRDLLLLTAERFDSSTLAARVRDFVREVLYGHPAFRSQSLAGVLENLPDAPGEERAVELLASQSYTSLQWPEGTPPLNRHMAQSCRTNAIYCLLLWFQQNRGTPFLRIHRYMHANLWAPAARRLNGDAQKLRVLMGARDQSAIGAACSVLEKHALDQERLVAAAQRSEESAVARARQREDELADVTSQLESATTRIAELTAEVGRLQQTHADQVAHLRNAHRELRGRVLHCLRQETALLAVGLQALRRQPPKPHVMDDHADRVLEGLKREIDRIERIRGTTE